MDGHAVALGTLVPDAFAAGIFRPIESEGLAPRAGMETARNALQMEANLAPGFLLQAVELL